MPCTRKLVGLDRQVEVLCRVLHRRIETSSAPRRRPPSTSAAQQATACRSSDRASGPSAALVDAYRDTPIPASPALLPSPSQSTRDVEAVSPAFAASAYARANSSRMPQPVALSAAPIDLVAGKILSIPRWSKCAVYNTDCSGPAPFALTMPITFSDSNERFSLTMCAFSRHAVSRETECLPASSIRASMPCPADCASFCATSCWIHAAASSFALGSPTR